MKKIAFLTIAFVLLASLVSPALAQNTFLEKNREGSKAAVKQERMQNKPDARIKAQSGNLQERAEKEIARRIESLEKLLIRITEFKKLTAAQKATLTSQVQAEIDKLTALQTKIAGTTDEATLKADVQSIITSYRIYALFIPKIQILGAADRTLNTADLMTTQATRLEAKITEQQQKGQDVTQAQLLLADMKIKITSAKTQAQSAIDTVTPLTPGGYPDNKTTLQDARQMVVDAKNDLHTARQDARKIIVERFKLEELSPSPEVTIQ